MFTARQFDAVLNAILAMVILFILVKHGRHRCVQCGKRFHHATDCPTQRKDPPLAT